MSENVKHSPGPWICYADLPSTEPNWHIVTTANKMRVLANVHIEPGNAMDEANARLIAAAPDLLEVAKDVIKLFHYHTEDAADAADFAAAVEIQLEAAIAKAEGRP